MSIILVDTETSDIKNPRLVSIAYKDGDDPIVQEIYKPAVEISIGAMAVHHITNEDVADKKLFSEDKDRYASLFAGKTAVAHNLPFDVGVLRNEGIDIQGGICTLKVARKLYPDMEEYKLQYLRYALKLPVDKSIVPHSAIGDVAALDALFKKMSEELSIESMIEITNQPVFYRSFYFGKHRGETIEDVARTDMPYILWLLNQQGLDDDFRYSLKTILKK